MRELQPVGGALQQLLRQLGLERQFRTYDALAHWSDIVGKQIAQVARPLRVDADTLWVAVKSHAWAQELNFQKGTILKRLNERAGEERFKELRFTVRSLPSPPNPLSHGVGEEESDSPLPRRERGAGGEGTSDVSPTHRERGAGGEGTSDVSPTHHGRGAGSEDISETELAQIESSLASVRDPTLRDALKRAQVASLQYQKRLAQLGWRRCVVCECYHSDDSAVCFLCERGV